MYGMSIFVAFLEESAEHEAGAEDRSEAGGTGSPVLLTPEGGDGYPGWGGGLWLRMILPSGLCTWLVPSGWTVRVQPSSCSTT